MYTGGGGEGRGGRNWHVKNSNAISSDDTEHRTWSTRLLSTQDREEVFQSMPI